MVFKMIVKMRVKTANDIKNEGVMMICEGLKTNTTLTELNVSCFAKCYLLGEKKQNNGSCLRINR